MTPELLKKCMPAATIETCRLFAPHLTSAMVVYNISKTPRRTATFLANLAHESGSLNNLEENLNYSAKRLLQIFPKYFTVESADQYARQPQKIANRVYANRMGNGDEASGDGWKFRGRGPTMNTGKYMYQMLTKELNYDFIADPAALLKPGSGSHAAAWFWDYNGLNRTADIEGLQKIRKKVNGGLIGYEDFLQHYYHIKEVLQVDKHTDSPRQMDELP